MNASAPLPDIAIDIVSDIVCPWCVIGYKQLETAMERLRNRATFHLRWRSYELNPWMPREGQDMAEHVAQKYGTSPEQSLDNRGRLAAMGERVGFPFAFAPGMRLFNSFDGHRLLHWAGTLSDNRDGEQTRLKLALFSKFFQDRADISDADVLLAAVAEAGLDTDAARDILSTGQYGAEVRAEEEEWQDRFISGVPAMIFGGKFLVPGAQEPETLVQIIEQRLLAVA